MFDYFRNLTKSAEEKRQEALNAYLDGELKGRARQQFEAELAQDASLRAELAELRQIRAVVRELPRVRAPRNFLLDPAVYGKPAPQPALQLYPVLRVATGLAAVLFVVALALDVVSPAGFLGPASPAGEVEETTTATFDVSGDAVAVTRIVTETAREVVEEEVEMEAEAAQVAPEEGMAADEAQEAEAVEAPAEEPAAEEEMAAEESPPPAAAVAPGTLAPEGTLGAAGAESAAPTATTTPTATATQTPTLTPTAESISALPPTVAPEPERDDGAQAAPAIPLLLIAEVLLGISLVALIVTMLLIRRQM